MANAPGGETLVRALPGRPKTGVIYAHGWRTTGARDLERFGLARILSGDITHLVVPQGADRSRFGVYEQAPVDSARAAALASGLPNAPQRWIIVSHSGGYRVPAAGADDPRVIGIVLADSTYGAEQALRRAARRLGPRMWVWTSSSSRQTQALADELGQLGASRHDIDMAHQPIAEHAFFSGVNRLRRRGPGPAAYLAGAVAGFFVLRALSK